MANDSLSLLFRIRGDATGAKAAAAETRAAVAGLRASLGSEFNQMQKAGQTALAGIGDSLNVFVGQRIPLVGGAFLRVSENLRTFGGDAKKGEQALAGLNKTIDGLSTSTGKSKTQITSFLTSFVQLETQAKRDAAAIEAFGAVAAQKLIPQLEKAGEEMATVAANGGAVSGALAGIPPQAAIAVVAIVAVTAAVALLTKAFLDLVVSTAEWQGKLFDLSQQTGVSVETLNALEIAANKTGGSIESVSQALVIFQGHLDEAQDSTTKMGAKFANLEINTKNTEDALRSAFAALAKMPEGFHQTNEAAELFGRRGGKQVLAIIKETNGDIDSAVTKLGGLARVTREQTKAADDFLDALRDVGTMVRGITALIVQDSIPQILVAVEDLTKVLNENREAVALIGKAITLFVEGNIHILNANLRIVTVTMREFHAVTEPFKELFAEITDRALTAANAILNIRDAINAAIVAGTADAGVFAQLGAGIKPETGDFGLFRKEPAKGAKEKISAGQKLLNQLTDEYNKLQEKANELTKVQIVAKELLDEQYKKLVTSTKAADVALEREIRTMAASIQTTEEKIESDKKQAETAEKIKQLREDTSKWLLEIIQNVNDAADGTDEFDIKLRELRVTAATLGIAFDAATEKLAALNAMLARAPKLAADFDSIMEGLNDDLVTQRWNLEKLTEKYRPYLEVLKEAEERNRKFTEKTDKELGPPPPVPLLKTGASASAIDQLFGAINKNLTGTAQTAARIGLETLTDAFSGLAQAVGQVVQAWVLYGKIDIRRVTAQILAGVAAQAAVKAVFELAEGFAALALAVLGIPNQGLSAAAHFQAAAIYGTIAGIAAIAGRAVAGDSFTKESSSGGSSSGGGSSGSRSTSTEIPTRDVNRNALAQPQTLTINLGLQSGIVAEQFRRDYMLNGITRLIIKTDGQG